MKKEVPQTDAFLPRNGPVYLKRRPPHRMKTPAKYMTGTLRSCLSTPATFGEIVLYLRMCLTVQASCLLHLLRA
uniref:Uncharacterized protein n=1 Tax=Sphaerodactylus townsendi TaxID=933632 RepID=A0ACB8ESR7_9SAUR